MTYMESLQTSDRIRVVNSNCIFKLYLISLNVDEKSLKSFGGVPGFPFPTNPRFLRL